MASLSPFTPTTEVSQFMSQVVKYVESYISGRVELQAVNGGHHFCIFLPLYYLGVKDCKVSLDAVTVASFLLDYSLLAKRVALERSAVQVLGDALLVAHFFYYAKELAQVRKAAADAGLHLGLQLVVLPPLGRLADFPLLLLLYPPQIDAPVRRVIPFLVYIGNNVLNVAHLGIYRGRVGAKQEVKLDLTAGEASIRSALGDFIITCLQSRKSRGISSISFLPKHLFSAYKELFLTPLGGILAQWDLPPPTVDFDAFFLPPVRFSGQSKNNWGEIMRYRALGFPLQFKERGVVATLLPTSMEFYPLHKVEYGFPSPYRVLDLPHQSILLILLAHAISNDFLSYYGSDIERAECTYNATTQCVSIYLRFAETAQRALSLLENPQPRFVAPPALVIVLSRADEEKVTFSVGIDIAPSSARVNKSIPISLREAVFMSFYERQESVPFWVKVVRVLGALA